jgi:hypothetical protein
MSNARKAGSAGGTPKSDWLCKFCPDKFRNYGHRDSCYRCHIEKGKSFGSLAPSKSRSPTTSLAEKQVADGKRQDKERIKALEAQIVGHKAVAKKLAERNSAPQPDEDECEVVPATKSLEQLLKFKVVLEGMGAGFENDIAANAAEIVAARESQLATKPSHVQLAQASHKVERAKALCSKHAAKTTELQVQLAALFESIKEHSVLVAEQEKNLLVAQAHYESTAKGINSQEAPAPEPSLACLGALLADLPVGSFAAIAALPPKDQAEAMQKMLRTSFEAKTAAEAAQQLQKQQQEAKATADATAAAAEAAATKVRLDAEQAARVEKGKASGAAAAPVAADGAAGDAANPPPDGSSLDDVDMDSFVQGITACLAAPNLDAGIKRDLEAQLGAYAQRVHLRRKTAV